MTGSSVVDIENGVEASRDLSALRVACASDSEAIRAHLYGCLTILDSKASSLLGINSVVAAAFAILLVPTFSFATALAVAAGMMFVFSSSLVAFDVIRVWWSTASGLEEMAEAERQALDRGQPLHLARSGHLEWLLALRRKRTVQYDLALRWAEGSMILLVVGFVARLLS